MKNERIRSSGIRVAASTGRMPASRERVLGRHFTGDVSREKRARRVSPLQVVDQAQDGAHVAGEVGFAEGGLLVLVVGEAAVEEAEDFFAHPVALVIAVAG